VCETLAAWSGDRLWTGSPHQSAVVGELEHVSNWLARVQILPAEGTGTEPIAELRVLPVATGREAITELLVVVACRGENDLPPRGDVHRARDILAAVCRRLVFGHEHRRAS
jgi:hypothetical protein